ncbi:MAG: hypothetical protein WAT71_18020 [Ignavibacteria bacterium]
MAKKDFKGGLSNLLGENTEAKNESVKAPSTEPQKRKEITKTTQEGTYEGDIRATFIVKENRLEILKALAYWERKKLKDLLDEALLNLIESRDPEQIKKVIEEYKKSINK